jgi:hypothetical protein
MQKMLDPADRDQTSADDLIRSRLRRRFVEQIRLQQNHNPSLRKKTRPGRSQITLEKNRAYLSIPKIGPAFQERHIFRPHRRLPECAVGRVLERPHHPGDIAQRGALEFALAQGSGWLAFEIENDKILPGVERLTEMIIAVNADLRRRVELQCPPLRGENLLFGG